jgi:hypothetical protein
MKKIISLLALCGMLVGCEIGVYPHPVKTTVRSTKVCEPIYADVYWTTYCEGGCCYYEYYDHGWTCEQAWCHDYHYCDWVDMGAVCY